MSKSFSWLILALVSTVLSTLTLALCVPPFAHYLGRSVLFSLLHFLSACLGGSLPTA